MDIKKLITGTLAGTVAGFIAGYLVFGMALSSMMAENMSMKEPPDFLWLILSHLAFACLITYVCLQWASIKTAATGAKAGAVMALLATLSFNWIYFATTDVFTGGIGFTFVDAIGAAVVWAIGGAAIGWALGMGD